MSSSLIWNARVAGLAGVLAAVACLLSGCAPAEFTEGIGVESRRAGVRDASASTVRGMGHLRFDTALRGDLDDALTLQQVEPMREAARKVLSDAHQLAMRLVHGELDRIPPGGLHALADCYGMALPPDASPDALRAAVRERFDQESGAALAGDLARIDSADSRAALRDELVRIRRRIEPEAGDAGRLARVLLTSPMYVPAALGAELADAQATRRATTAAFSRVQVYSPAPPETTLDESEWESARLEELMRQFAPHFVQEIDPDAGYAPTEDRIGRVYLSGSPGAVRVNVDVQDPVVYWKHAQAKVRDRRYDQLVYVAWYPSRPALSPGDPQAGRIDGVVVRITLDRRRRPAVYEFVRTCGCYHTLWVADHVEKAALAEFGGPLPGMAFAVQKRPERSRELFMPALVSAGGSEQQQRPVVLVNAGQHLVVTIAAGGANQFAPADQPPRTYRLEPYEVLTQLPLDGQVASMFNEEGLVHDAARAESWMLAPTGMLQAGRPRQLGTMKIRMDAYDYDDPRLLERNLRLPSDF